MTAVRKLVTITEEQSKYIKEKKLKLSHILQDKIDDLIKEDTQKIEPLKIIEPTQ